MTGTASNVFEGRRILIAEDEYMIAQEVDDVFRTRGAEVIGPMATVVQVLRSVTAGDRIDAAVLDVNLRGEMVWPAVDALLSRGTPVVLSTGYDDHVIPAAYAHLPRLEKPLSAQTLVSAVSRQLVPAGEQPGP